MKFSRPRAWGVVIATAIITSLLPWLFRRLSGNQTFPGDTSYAHSLAQTQSNPFGWLLQVFPDSSLFIIPILLGILSAILLFKVLELFPFSIQERVFIVVLWCISPGFFFLASNLTHWSLVIVLVLTGLLCLVSTRYYLATIPLILLGLFDTMTAGITAILFIVISAKLKDQYRFTLAAIPAIVAVAANTPTQLIPLPYDRLFVELFSDLGGQFGLGLVNVLIAVIGFLTFEKEKFTGSFYVLSTFLIIATLASPALILYVSLVVAIGSGVGIVYLLNRRWSSQLIQAATIIVIISGILFSTTAYLDRVSTLPPDQGVIEGAQWLGQHTQGTILSHESKSHWIAYGSGRDPFINSFSDQYANRVDIANQIFYSTDFRATTALLEQHQITTLWIDAQMRNGQVWMEKDEGLLFQLSNERFKKIYDKNGVEIWSFN